MLVLMFVWGSNMSADNVLSVNQISIRPGSTAELVVSLENDADFSVYAYDFRLYLPEGIEVATKSNGSYEYELKERNSDHSSNVLETTDGSIQFGVNSSNLALTGNTGEVLGITLKASETLAEGTYQASIKNITYANKEAQTVHPADITFNIVVKNQVILDENSTTLPPAEALNTSVLVKRTIKANSWSTICLPFAMSEAQVKAAFGDDVQLADFTGYDVTEDDEENIVGITVKFDAVTAIEANHPYIINVSEPVSEFTVDEVDIAPTEYAPCVSFGYETGRRPVVYHPADFIGTYVADFDFFNDAERAAIFLNDNKFWYATASTSHMKAFRAYFDFDDILTEVEDASMNVKMAIDGESTRIDGLLPETSNDAIYDLTGRKVEKAEKGIYIVNGKKVLK